MSREGKIIPVCNCPLSLSAVSSPALSGKRKRDNEAEEEIEETAQEKKLRLAKLYLEQLRQQGEHLISWGAMWMGGVGGVRGECA